MTAETELSLARAERLMASPLTPDERALIVASRERILALPESEREAAWRAIARRCAEGEPLP